MKRIIFVLALILSFSLVSIANAELVGYWNFNENTGTIAHDSSSYGNDGTIYSATWTTGRMGSALSFDGVDDYVNIDDVPALDISSAITLEAWVKNNLGLSNTVISKDDDGANREYYMGLSYDAYNPGRARWALNTSGFGVIDSTAVLNNGEWHYIAVTYNGSYMRLYIDGQEDSSSPIAKTGLIPNTQAPFRIGAMSDIGYEQYFRGIIDEVRVYNHALTLEEIQTDMMGGSGPLAYWKFDEGTGTIAYDSSINSYDGTINGASWIEGQIGPYALDFDGVNDRVDIPSSENVNIIDAVTIEAWVKFDELSTSRGQIIVDKWQVGSRSFNLFKDIDSHQNKIAFCLWADGDVYIVNHLLSNTSVQVGEWTHVAVTYDGSMAKIYINGTLENSVTASGQIHQGGSNIEIGGDIDETGLNLYFDGIIDDVHIYNRALTQEEILADMGIIDTDGDGISDGEDNCPQVFNQSQWDFDNDGVGDWCDNCPLTANPRQLDSNGNEKGDKCENCTYQCRMTCVVLEEIPGE
jgi:hypothetical protein